MMTQSINYKNFWLSMAVIGMLALNLVPKDVSAFDISANVSKESGPFDLFRFGFKAYRSGDTEQAVEAYKYAAEKGHTGSRWALANMYAFGDGVSENDYEAFKLYVEIVNQSVEPKSPDTGFYVNALLALAAYYQTGIVNTPVEKDLSQARQLYFQAASVFNSSEAQFRLARMVLRGEGGGQNIRLAKKWLHLAKKNGNVSAMAMLGDLIFNEGQPVLGLAYMTMAVDECKADNCVWIRELQEKSFSIVTESDRRCAVALAHNMSISLP